LAAGTLVAGWGLRLLLPGAGFEAPPPWAAFLGRCTMVYLSAWLLVALQTWVGLRWHSFVVAASAGIVLTVAGMFIVNAEWGYLYPWALPGLIANGFSKGAAIPVGRVFFGSLGGLLAAVAGGWEMTRRDVT
jgi:ABC-2 type transport system permease protein